MSDTENSIWVITSGASSDRELLTANRGIREITERALHQGVRIPLEQLKTDFESFFKNIITLINAVPDSDLSYRLDEIEIYAEISGEGKIQLVGGLTAGAKGGIKFKLKRVASAWAAQGTVAKPQ
jgi:hypothetical protein